MRLPLIIATAVLLVVGVLAGAIALGSSAGAGAPSVEPITVRAPAAPPAPREPAPQEPAPQEPAPQPAPRDEAGYVVPPPPVDDDDDDRDDDGPDDDD
jgi:hypothetical protein